MKKKTLYTFDVFDTLLTRNINEPTDLFLLLSERVLSEGIIEDHLARKFSNIRIWSEYKARRLSARGEVNLDEIYDVVQKYFDIEKSNADEIKSLELNLEELVISPIGGGVKRLEGIRESNRGNRVAFISDMYLPAWFVRKLLDKFNILREEDSVYVSSETGNTKTSGKMYLSVMERENVNPVDVIHFGDDIYSDVFVPNRLGIETQEKFVSQGLLTAKALSHRFFKTLRYIRMISVAKAHLGNDCVN